MGEDVPRAGGLNRALAVFVDTLVFLAIWTAVGFVIPYGSLLYGLGVFLLMDVVLTAFFGLTVGRFVTRIRVVRAADGGQPGLFAALVRTGLVVISGWIGPFAYLLSLRAFAQGPPRMWWDAAAGTRLVSAASR